MDIGVALSLVREALWLTLILSGPLLIVSLLTGVVVGVFQAATQVHEATLVFAPKLILSGVVLLILGAWQWSLLVEFTRRLITDLPTFAR
jgi:flagellar biosynthetic protein FliQ